MHTISLWCFSLILSFLCIITLSTTKLAWYDMPLYPYLAIVTGYAIYHVARQSKYFMASTVWQPFMVVLLFSVPLYYAIKQSHNNDRKVDEQKQERIVDYIFTKENEGANLNNYSICDSRQCDQYLFYKYMLNDKGQYLAIVDTNTIAPLTKVIAKDAAIKRYIQNKFSYTIADSVNEVVVFNVEKKR